MKLDIPVPNVVRYFSSSTANITSIGEKKIQFIQDKLFSFTLVNKQQNYLVFSYKLYQNKISGSSLLHYYSGDMEELQSNLVFKTDLRGRLVDLFYFEKLKEHWAGKILKQVTEKYPADFVEPLIVETSVLLNDLQRFLRSYEGYSLWRFFFQEWYRQFEEVEKETLVINQYFGNIDLPLNLVRKVLHHKILKSSIDSIAVQGTLDNEQFNRPAFLRMLKDLTHIVNIDSTLDVDMEENYHFNRSGELLNGDMFLKTSVGDWYSVVSAHQIECIEEEAFRSKVETMKMERVRENL